MKPVPAKRPWVFSVSSDGSKFTNEEGDVLFRKVWPLKPQAKLRGLVFIAHGMAEHVMRYEGIAHTLNGQGLFVIGHDHAGHGQSTGKRTYVTDFQIFVRDLLNDVQFTLKTLPAGTPCFLIGISMGGAICLHASMQRPDLFKGMVLLAPAVMTDPASAKPHLIKIARMLSRKFPTVRVGRADDRFVTRNKDELKKARKDELIYHGKLRAGFAMLVFDAMQFIVDNSKQIVTPMLVQHGLGDHICNIDGTRFLEKNTGSSDVTVRLYEGMYHDLLHEVPEDTRRVTIDLVQWILGCLGEHVYVGTEGAPAAAAAAAAAAAPVVGAAVGAAEAAGKEHEAGTGVEVKRVQATANTDSFV